MHERHIFLLSMCLSAALTALCASGGSLETDFTSVTAKDLPIGHRAPLRASDGRQYTIRNNSEQTVEVEFSALKPFQKKKGERRAYADIPDPSWLSFEPASVKLGPHEEGKIELRLAVPDDKNYANGMYEVWFLAQTKGGQMGVGLITRIKFNTVEKPAAASETGTPPAVKKERDAPSSDTGKGPQQEK